MERYLSSWIATGSHEAYHCDARADASLLCLDIATHHLLLHGTVRPQYGAMPRLEWSLVRTSLFGHRCASGSFANLTVGDGAIDTADMATLLMVVFRVHPFDALSPTPSFVRTVDVRDEVPSLCGSREPGVDACDATARAASITKRGAWVDIVLDDLPLVLELHLDGLAPSGDSLPLSNIPASEPVTDASMPELRFTRKCEATDCSTCANIMSTRASSLALSYTTISLVQIPPSNACPIDLHIHLPLRTRESCVSLRNTSWLSDGRRGALSAGASCAASKLLNFSTRPPAPPLPSSPPRPRRAVVCAFLRGQRWRPSASWSSSGFSSSVSADAL